jgi:hypothetical protein
MLFYPNKPPKIIEWRYSEYSITQGNNQTADTVDVTNTFYVTNFLVLKRKLS